MADHSQSGPADSGIMSEMTIFRQLCGETATTLACAAQTMAPIANRFVPITAFLTVALEGYSPNGAALPDEHHGVRRISQRLSLLL
jgi:hypothetical protein